MKAKIKLSISFFLQFFTISVFSQVSVIVVDDSSDNFDNTKELTSVLDSLGVEYFILMQSNQARLTLPS
ncbi:MAG: hypothetical protein IPL08_11490 [Saprospiraceae bacterium]|nr:hypothetical protein [Saprospiraceae bacterium]